MSNDVGQLTGDAADATPPSPLAKLAGLNATPIRKRLPKVLHRLQDFNPDLGVQQKVTKARDLWWGFILDIDTVNEVDKKKYYEVQLQDGQFVQAYYPEQAINHEWKDNQRVQLMFDGVEYIILTTPNQKELHLWWEALDTVIPGGEGKGKLRSYDETDETFKDYGSEIIITDTEHRNFILRGEKTQIRLNDLKYEFIGSFGLFRPAKTKVRIAPSVSGLVTVYSKGIKATEPKDAPLEAQDQDVEVTAWAAWGAGGKPFEAAKEVYIRYMTDHEKWYLVGGEC